MSLYCSVDADDDVVAIWWNIKPDSITLETSKRKRCMSCKSLIDKGSDVFVMERWRAIEQVYRRLAAIEAEIDFDPIVTP